MPKQWALLAPHPKTKTLLLARTRHHHDIWGDWKRGWKSVDL